MASAWATAVILSVISRLLLQSLWGWRVRDALSTGAFGSAGAGAWRFPRGYAGRRDTDDPSTSTWEDLGAVVRGLPWRRYPTTLSLGSIVRGCATVSRFPRAALKP